MSRRVSQSKKRGPTAATSPTLASANAPSANVSSSVLTRGLVIAAVLSTLTLLAMYVLLPSNFEVARTDRQERLSGEGASPEGQQSGTTAVNSIAVNAATNAASKPFANASALRDESPAPLSGIGAGLNLPVEPLMIDTEPQQKQLLADVEDAVTRFPQGADVLHLAGLTYGELLQTERAAELFRQSLEVAPRNRDVLVAYSDMLTQIGTHEEAISALEQGIKAGIDDATIRASLGNAYIQVGEAEKGAEVLRRGIELDPQHAPLRLALAQAQVQLEQFAEAEENARLALNLGEKSRATYVVLTSALVRLGKREEATALRQEMPTLEPNTIDDPRYQDSFREFASHTYGLLALAFQSRGLMVESEQWWLRSLEYFPNSPKSLAALADICHRSGRLADALQIYQRLLQADPQNLVNYSNCASIALQLGNTPLAEDALRQATAVDKSGYADLYLARFQFELGKFPEAAQNAATAAERSADVEAYLVLIAAQQALGKPALAFEALRKARGVAPNDPRLMNIQL